MYCQDLLSFPRIGDNPQGPQVKILDVGQTVLIIIRNSVF